MQSFKITAILVLLQVLAAMPLQSADVDLDNVNNLIANGKIAEAEKSIGDMLNTASPGSPAEMQLKDILASCYYRQLNISKADEIWKGITQSDTAMKAEFAWRDYVIFLFNNGQYDQAIEVAKRGAPDVLNLALLGKNVYENNMDNSRTVQNKLDLFLLLEYDYLYNKNLIDIKKLKVDDVKCTLEYGDQKIEIDPEDLGSVHFYLRDFELAEKYLRLTIKDMASSVTTDPRTDKYVLRLARCFREEKEYLLADALVKFADEFIVSHYSENSPLRVWTIEERYRLFRIAHRNEEATTLLDAAKSKFKEYINRFNSIEEQYSDKNFP